MTQTSLSLRRNVLWNTVGCVFYQGCLWLITVLVVRLSSNFDNSGILSLAMSLGNVYFAMATYNIRPYQISDMAHKYSPSEYIALRVLTVVAAYALFLVYALMTGSSQLAVLGILAYLLFKADESFCNVLYGIDQQNMRLDFVGKSQILRGCALVAAFSIGLTITQDLPSALLAMTFICMAITFVYDIRKAKRLSENIRPRISAVHARALLAECLPSVISLILSGLVATVSRQLFYSIYGESALGIYASVATPAVLIQVLASNVYTPLIVPFSEKIFIGNIHEAKRDLIKLIGLIVGISLIVTAALSLSADIILPLVFGDAIRPYCYLLMPALVVAGGVALVSLISDCLVAIRHLRESLFINTCVLLATLISFSPLVGSFYMNGLSFSMIIGYGIGFTLGLAVILNKLKVMESGSVER